MPYDLDPKLAALLSQPNPVAVVTWIETNGEAFAQIEHARGALNNLLWQASQPRSASGNACVRLCGFVGQCSASQTAELQAWACSETPESLLEFYLHWSETDQHRSMKLVLDLIVQLIRRNPDPAAAQSTRRWISDSLTTIVTGKSTKPVVRSAIKVLDHYLVKNLITLGDIWKSYAAFFSTEEARAGVLWHGFLKKVALRLRQQFICPTAGRFLVSLYHCIRQQDRELVRQPSVELWQEWLLGVLVEDVSLLESLKNYFLLPLFKTDKTEALRILQKMNDQSTAARPGIEDLNAYALLRLAALEAGKKVGLVEEPALRDECDESDDVSIITLHAETLHDLLGHPSHDVRSLAFSLLITSPSTTRPYSYTALGLLRQHLGSYFADADAKFRVDVSAKARDMYKRLRGAIHLLKRSIPRSRAHESKVSHDSVYPAGASGLVSRPILYQSNLIKLPEGQLVYCLTEHEKFLTWYLDFLRDELMPTGSYQRHIASLKSLQYILGMEADSSKTWQTTDDGKLYYDKFDRRWVRALLDMVMDPFEDVRDASSAVLKKILSDRQYRKASLFGRGQIAQEIAFFLERADTLARRTSRADHSDGVARANQLHYRLFDAASDRISHLSKLVTELERRVVIAEHDLGLAVLEAPLHGHFASLCSIWQVASEMVFSEEELTSMMLFQERLVAASERVWDVVRDALCDDSPEGHLPQELEEIDGLDTKNVLSYSFRSIHASSNLMRIIALTVRNRAKSGSVWPSRDLFARLGGLTFMQLSTLRHRGAFTTVSQTFAVCCQQSKNLESRGSTGTLVMAWYNGTMKEVLTQSSTTRRSAGIPSLMTGILSANADFPSFEQVMERLMQIAGAEARISDTDGSNLPQVHAYNCLKDIFKNSVLTSLGNKSAKYLSSCLKLAASGLKSEVWAIRNCGLIFLRSLVDCLFGNHETKAMIEAGWDGQANRIPYHKYPDLPGVLLDLLRSGNALIATNDSAIVAAESVFPALDIIRRAGPPDLLRGQIRDHVSQYLASPVWHLRDMAARTMCSCLLNEDWVTVVGDLLRDLLDNTATPCQNHIHGILSTIKLMIGRLREIELDQIILSLPKLSQVLETETLVRLLPSCPEVKAVYLEVGNSIMALGWQVPQSDLLSDIIGQATSGTPLLRIEQIITQIYIVAGRVDPVTQLRKILCASQIGVNTMVAALEILPKVWDPKEVEGEMLVGFCELYVDICLASEAAEGKTACLKNLTAALDQLLTADSIPTADHELFLRLWTELTFSSMNPELCNSVIRISGCLMAILTRAGCVERDGLANWGYMMSSAEQDDQSLDARLAAVQSLCSFFTVVKSSCVSTEHISSLLALYDGLNDDDDEVRDEAAVAAKAVLGQAFVPLEAADRLLHWLATQHRNNVAFRAVVASRIVSQPGAREPSLDWRPANDQLTEALRFDGSLFVVEEQNLFVDEVRETQRWASLLRILRWDESKDKALLALNGWVAGGLHGIKLLVDKEEDGPLGWASNPQVFAVCMRVAIMASTLVDVNLASAELRSVLADLTGKLRSCEAHISGYLCDALFVEASQGP